MAQGSYHVVHRAGNWTVMREGTDRLFSTHMKKEEAVLAARELAKQAGVDVVLHMPDGTIEVPPGAEAGGRPGFRRSR